MKEKTLDPYKAHYSEKRFWTKIGKYAKKLGIKGVYTALLLFYTLIKPTTPAWARTVIVGALGYFILPLDLIPDFIVGAGYTDDFGALLSALITVSMYIDEDSKAKARERLSIWFGRDILGPIQEVEAQALGKVLNEQNDQAKDPNINSK